MSNGGISRSDALLEWISSIDGSVPIESLNTTDLWLKIYPEYFKSLKQKSDALSLLDLILGWFAEKAEYSQKNLSKIEKSLKSNFSKYDLNQDQIVTIAGLILVMAVQSYSNTYFIDKMQGLSLSAQHVLKDIIQDIMEQLTIEIHDISDVKETTVDKKTRDLQAQLREVCLDLDESNLKLQEKSEIIDKLKRQVQENSKYKEDYLGIKDKLQELEFISEKCSKTELILKKYKAKLDELMSFKGRVKEMEDLLLLKDTEISTLQEELRKDGLLKRMMSSYKDQITRLETSNSALQVDKDGLSAQILELSDELGNVKVQSQEQINLLNQKIIEISKKDSDYQKEEEAGKSLDEIHRIGQLNDKLSASREEIAQLSDKLMIMENELDDMTRLKNAFEHDYRRSHEMNTRLQMENQNLIAKLDKAADGASLLKKLEDSQKIVEETSQTNLEQSQKIASMTEQLQKAQEDCKSKHVQVNKLVQEKEDLETKFNQMKERLSLTDQLLAESKASVKALKSQNGSSENINCKLAAATQKIVQLTDQNALLHQALRKAKNHILFQDKAIKEGNSSKMAQSDQFYSEAIQSYQTQISEKQVEIQRLKKDLQDLKESTKREEEFMSSAWYNLCSSIQPKDHENLAGSSNWLKLHKSDKL